MHPPFGIALYNLRSVAPATVHTTQIYMGAIPILAILPLMVGILVLFPGIATTQQILVQATDQEVEDALRPAPVEPSAEPEFS